MIEFKDMELKEALSLFNEFCDNTPAITADDWNSKFKELLQPKVYEILKGDSENKEADVKKALYEALDETRKWEYEVDSFEGFLLKKGIITNEEL